MLPINFIDKIKQVLPNEWEALIAAIDSQPIVSIRKNKAKKSVVDFPDTSSIAWSDEGLYLAERPYFTHDPLLHAGGYYVQEASSMFLAQMVGPFLAQKENPIVLDFCAAPGGKSSHLLSVLNGKGLLVSNEIIANRNAILRENLTKWGMPNYVVTQGDATQFSKAGALFDLIVIDAPCSGEGMFRKDKRAIEEWSLDNVARCVERQTSILEKLMQCLKPGGMLVYSTCTFEPDENINQIVQLSRNLNFKSISVDFDIAKNGITKIEKEGVVGYQFYPHKSKGEGFFIAAIQHSGVATDEAAEFSFQNRYAEVEHLVSPFTNYFVKKEQAVRFLKCETLHFSDQEKGWYLVTYQGLGLGWAKVMENRTNNYYPSNWRILK